MARQDSNMYKSVWIKIKEELTIISVLVLLTVVIFPLLFFIVLPATLVARLVVKLIAAACCPDLCDMYEGKGAIYAIEPIYTRPKTNILLYCFCNNGPLPVEQSRAQFEQRVLNHTNDQGARPYERLTRTLTNFMGFIFWKRDENFQLANHIRLYDYTEPELALPSKCHESDLKRITGDLLARAWVAGQSPWELLIVPDYRADAESEKTGALAILRIHHSLADGYSIFTMLLRFTNSLNVKRVLPKFPQLSTLQKLRRPLLFLLTAPHDFAQFLLHSYDRPNCWNFPEKKLSRKFHVFLSDEIEVTKVKKIRKKYGFDYQSTVYSVACGAIRRLMLDSGQELPGSLSVLIPVPQPHHPGGLVVHTLGTCFKFYPRPRVASASERIRQVGGNLKSLREHPSAPIVNGWFLEVVGQFPAFLLGFLNNNFMTATAVMSSIPGPEVELPVIGQTNFTSMCFVLGQTSGIGANAGFLTMAGKQRITLSVDKSIFEGFKVPTRFAEFVNQEIDELLNTKEICE